MSRFKIGDRVMHKDDDPKKPWPMTVTGIASAGYNVQDDKYHKAWFKSRELELLPPMPKFSESMAVRIRDGVTATPLLQKTEVSLGGISGIVGDVEWYMGQWRYQFVGTLPEGIGHLFSQDDLVFANPDLEAKWEESQPKTTDPQQPGTQEPESAIDRYRLREITDVEMVWQCEEGCDLVKEEPESPLYECSSCGTAYNRDGSADGCSNRCPNCNKFGGRIADHACQECGTVETTEVEAILCPSCEEYVVLDEYDDHLADNPDCQKWMDENRTN